MQCCLFITQDTPIPASLFPAFFSFSISSLLILSLVLLFPFLHFHTFIPNFPISHFFLSFFLILSLFCCFFLLLLVSHLHSPCLSCLLSVLPPPVIHPISTPSILDSLTCRMCISAVNLSVSLLFGLQLQFASHLL